MNNEKEIIFWGAGTARTFRPIWMAEELNLPYKLYPIGPRTGETQTKEYTELNPKQKIPLLKHGDFLLSESLAICRYLQDVSFSNEVFVSREKKIKALEDQWSSDTVDLTPEHVERGRRAMSQYYEEWESLTGVNPWRDDEWV